MKFEACKVVALTARVPEGVGTQHYGLIKSLGSGSFGEVWEARQLKVTPASSSNNSCAVLGAPVALKATPRFSRTKHWMHSSADAYHEQQCTETANEYMFSDQVNEAGSFPQYVVRHLGWGVIKYADGQKVTYLLSEFADLGSLDQQIRNEAVGAAPLSPADCRRGAAEIGLALFSCHQADVIHRDVKASNVLRSSGPNGPVCKLADLGVSRYVSRMVDTTRGVHGSPAFMAPEMDGRTAITPKVDVWSYGCFYLEIR